MSVTLVGITGACVRFVQSLKQKLMSVTLAGITGACVRFVQSLKQELMSVTPSGIPETCTRVSHSRKQEYISVSPAIVPPNLSATFLEGDALRVLPSGLAFTSPFKFSFVSPVTSI